MTARILIVEDERITGEDLRDILTQLGYIVTAVSASAADAIKEARRTSPDLVMMDIRIEGPVDGIDAARALKNEFGIPAVFLTAHADEETLTRAKEAEPLGYIVKPFQEREVRAVIEVALHKSRLDRDRASRDRQLSAAFAQVGS